MIDLIFFWKNEEGEEEWLVFYWYLILLRPALHFIMNREVYVLLRDSGMVLVAFLSKGELLRGERKLMLQ